MSGNTSVLDYEAGDQFPMPPVAGETDADTIANLLDHASKQSAAFVSLLSQLMSAAQVGFTKMYDGTNTISSAQNGILTLAEGGSATVTVDQATGTMTFESTGEENLGGEAMVVEINATASTTISAGLISISSTQVSDVGANADNTANNETFSQNSDIDALQTTNGPAAASADVTATEFPNQLPSYVVRAAGGSPPSHSAGKLWYCTADGGAYKQGRLYRSTGSAWELNEDSLYATTITSGQIALTEFTGQLNAVTQITAGTIVVAKFASNATDRMFTSSTEQTNMEAWISADVTKIDGGAIYAGSAITVGSATKSGTITIRGAAGQGDAVIRSNIGGSVTDFGLANPGFILGMDDSDSDKYKFEIGSATDYFKWDGTVIKTSSVSGSSQIEMTAGELTLKFSSVVYGYIGSAPHINTGEALLLTTGSTYICQAYFKNQKQIGSADHEFILDSLYADAGGNSWGSGDQSWTGTYRLKQFALESCRMSWLKGFSLHDVTVGSILVGGGTASNVTKLDIGSVGEVLTVNSGGTAPEWASAPKLKISTYTGDGNATQGITGVGFQPDAVMVIPDENGGNFCHIKTSGMGGTDSKSLASAALNTDAITALDADGFTVGDGSGGGSNDNMNDSGVNYAYMAWKE